MSYVLIDEDNQTVDLATSRGLDDLYDNGSDELKRFIDNGGGTAADLTVILDELTANDQDLAQSLKKLKGDIILTNGIEDE